METRKIDFCLNCKKEKTKKKGESQRMVEERKFCSKECVLEYARENGVGWFRGRPDRLKKKKTQ